jgi:hypothetical protein
MHVPLMPKRMLRLIWICNDRGSFQYNCGEGVLFGPCDESKILQEKLLNKMQTHNGQHRMRGGAELYSAIVCESWAGASCRDQIRSKAGWARGAGRPRNRTSPHENVYAAISSGCLDPANPTVLLIIQWSLNLNSMPTFTQQ